MGLFLALVGRRVLVTQMLLAVGRKERAGMQQVQKEGGHVLLGLLEM